VFGLEKVHSGVTDCHRQYRAVSAECGLYWGGLWGVVGVGTVRGKIHVVDSVQTVQ
jgi:hypothetical protein